MIKDKFNLTDEDVKMCRQIYYRMMSLSASYDYEKMQALSYLRAMIPAINRFNDTDEKRREAYKRHWELFNTTPTVAGLITGLTAAMERQAAEDPSMDASAINAVKVSLMGPFAGIGDSIFWGSWRIVATGIGLSFALQGSILGPILTLLVFNIPAHFVRYYGPMIGYGMGSKFMTTASESGLMEFLTKAASIVGLMTVGAMTSSMVNLKTTYVFMMNGAEMSLQSMIDQILPCALPLGLTFLCFRLLNKGMKANTLIFLLIIVAIIGRFFGIV